jgi:putative ABC transport system permease protein
VAQDAAPGELLVPIEQTQSARDFTLGGPFGTRFGAPSSPYTGLFVVADGLDQVSPLREQITMIGYSTSAPENLIETVERYLHVVEIVLTAIGLIALVIASIGIASALLAAVRERHREIGVLKAIGARDRDVRRIFLLEAGLIGLAGGLVGTTAGWLIARSVGAVVNGYLASEGLRGVSVGLSWLVAVLGIAGTTLLALAAGTLPAARASHVSAREAVDSL